MQEMLWLVWPLMRRRKSERPPWLQPSMLFAFAFQIWLKLEREEREMEMHKRTVQISLGYRANFVFISPWAIRAEVCCTFIAISMSYKRKFSLLLVSMAHIAPGYLRDTDINCRRRTSDMMPIWLVCQHSLSIWQIHTRDYGFMCITAEDAWNATLPTFSTTL